MGTGTRLSPFLKQRIASLGTTSVVPGVPRGPLLSCSECPRDHFYQAPGALLFDRALDWIWGLVKRSRLSLLARQGFRRAIRAATFFVKTQFRPVLVRRRRPNEPSRTAWAVRLNRPALRGATNGRMASSGTRPLGYLFSCRLAGPFIVNGSDIADRSCKMSASMSSGVRYRRGGMTGIQKGQNRPSDKD